MIQQLCNFLQLKKGCSIFILGAISLCMLAGCNDTSVKKNKTVPKVSVISVNTVSVTPSKDFVVRTSAVDSVDLIARVQGFLIQRNFTEGSMVKKGQLLYKIDPTEYKVAVDKAQAQLDSEKAKHTEARLDLKRGEQLVRQKLISNEAYDKLISTAQQDKAAVEVSRAALEQAKINLSYTDIRAPFDGMVGNTNYHVGSFVDPSDSQALSKVTSVDPVYVSFQVNEQDFIKYFSERKTVSALKNHLDFTLTLSDGTAYPQHGTLNFIDPVVDTDTDTITLRASFPNPTGTLRPGMYATMRVSNTHSHILPEVPQIAIQHGKNGAFVYVVNKGKVSEVPVTLGPQASAFQSIMKGIKAGDKVVIQGFMKIQQGTTVNATEVRLDSQGNISSAKRPATTKQSD